MNKMYKTKQFVLKYLQNFLVELIIIVIANDTTQYFLYLCQDTDNAIS